MRVSKERVQELIDMVDGPDCFGPDHDQHPKTHTSWQSASREEWQAIAAALRDYLDLLEEREALARRLEEKAAERDTVNGRQSASGDAYRDAARMVREAAGANLPT